MDIQYDEAKRAKTLEERGLDFADAVLVFGGLVYTVTDSRREYGEVRNITYGLIDGDMVVIVWTLRGEARRIISMRCANEREQAKFQGRLG